MSSHPAREVHVEHSLAAAASTRCSTIPNSILTITEEIKVADRPPSLTQAGHIRPMTQAALRIPSRRGLK